MLKKNRQRPAGLESKYLFPCKQTSAAAAECFLFGKRSPHISPSLQRLSLKIGSEVKVLWEFSGPESAG